VVRVVVSLGESRSVAERRGEFGRRMLLVDDYRAGGVALSHGHRVVSTLRVEQKPHGVYESDRDSPRLTTTLTTTFTYNYTKFCQL